MTAMAADEHDQIRNDFLQAVNMSPGELEKWLQTEESQRVGWGKEDGGESVGHESGRRIVTIKRKRKADLTGADLDHMRKVTGYVHRHLKQGGPDADRERSPWRCSLMNWGHDPLKD